MITLKEAIEKGNLALFIKERKRDPNGNADASDKVIRSMAGKLKPTRKTSSHDDCDD